MCTQVGCLMSSHLQIIHFKRHVAKGDAALTQHLQLGAVKDAWAVVRFGSLAVWR